MRLRTCLVLCSAAALLLLSCAEGASSDTVNVPGPERVTPTSGGGTLETERFQLEVSVAPPPTAHRLKTERFQLQVGVGPFLATSERLDPTRKK